MNRVLVLLLSLPFQCLTVVASAQADTAFVATATASALKLYDNTVLEQSSLLVGAAFPEKEFTDDEHPYFLADTLQQADILYNGQLYTHVPMLFDMTGDRVVIRNPFLGQLMMLIDQKVGGFAMQGRRFLYLKFDSAEPGFYEVLHEGRAPLYCRRTKSFQKSTIGNERMIYYSVRNRYYVMNGGELSQVANPRTLLRTMRNQKNSMRQFIRDNKLDFERELEESLLKCTQHYDQLVRHP